MARVDLNRYCHVGGLGGEVHRANKFGQTMGCLWSVCKDCKQTIYTQHPYLDIWRTWTVLIEEEPV